MIIHLFVPAVCVSAATSTDGYFTFSYYSSTKTATINKCDTNASGDIVIPDYFGNYKVTEIFNNAFKGCKKIESITMADTVKKIGGYVFQYCTSLKTVKLSSNLTSIGAYSFQYCYELTEVNLPSKLTALGNNVFSSCKSLKSLTVPKSVTSIGKQAFSGCVAMESITLPFIGGSDTENNYIGYVFGGNDSYLDNAKYLPETLKDITILDSCTTIGNGALYGSAIEQFTIPSSVKTVGDHAFGNCDNLVDVFFEEGVTSLGGNAFSSCDKLKNVTLPESLTTINYNGFIGCTELEYLFIPKGVTSLVSSSFSGCDKLIVEVSEENPAFCSENGILYNKDKTDLFYCSPTKTGDITLPETVQSIKGTGFESCSGITSVKLHEGITYVGVCSFEDCTALKEIVFPQSLTYLGEYAFQRCTELESVTFNDSSVLIEDSVFSGCTELKTLDLGNNISGIDNYAFAACYKLTDVDIPDSVQMLGKGVFSGSYNIETITLGSGVKTIASNAFGSSLKCLNIKDMAAWCNVEMEYNTNPLLFSAKLYLNGELVKNLEIPEGVSVIKYSVFAGLKEIDNVILPSTLTSIKAVNFYDCEINENVFYNGSKTDFENVEVVSYNDKLNTANFVFSKCICGNEDWEWKVETKPTYIARGKANGVCTVCAEKQSKILSPTGIVKVGDIDGDELVDALDLTMLRQLMLNGSDNQLILDAADADGNNKLDISDLVRLKKYIAKFDVNLG